MLATKNFLARCQKLRDLKFKFTPEIGMRIGRGFADLGFEEFSVITNNRMISLFTGAISEISPEYEEHFFPIPTPDQATEWIVRNGYDIGDLSYIDQRTWRLEIIDSNSKRSALFEGSEIQDVFLDALIHCAGSSNV